MLWPLLLRYIERHCDKWNKRYQTKKWGACEVRSEVERVRTPAGVPGSPPTRMGRGTARTDLQRLLDSLSPEEVVVFECWKDQQSLAATALKLGCCEAKVSYLRKAIRERLEEM